MTKFIGKKILYIANVQGPKIVKERNINRNYNIAGNTKVFAICKALQIHEHTVIIYSMGTVGERTGEIYFSSNEKIKTTKGGIKVFYGATINKRYLRKFVEWCSAFYSLPAIFLRNPIDTVFIYNINLLSFIVAVVSRCCGKLVFMEYEDSALIVRTSIPPWWKKIYRIHEKVLRKILTGAFAPNRGLLKDIGVSNSLCLPGALSEDMVAASSQSVCTDLYSQRPLRLIYAGGLDASKGIDLFLEAIEEIDSPLEIHVFGRGPLEKKINRLCRESRHLAIFHGLVTREELHIEMSISDVGINAHRSDLHEGGTWPFKVVEYLALCGTVFCNLSADIPRDLKDKLFLYDANESKCIKESFEKFLRDWPKLSKSAHLRREWAIQQFGPMCLATKLETLMDGECEMVF